MSDIKDMPRDLAERFLALFTQTNGHTDVKDPLEAIKFIVEYGERYPFLFDLVDINEEAVIEHYQKTGEVPPGIKLIGTSTTEGDNVTYLEILQGPIPPKR
jgi:hypothetical protein